MASMERIVITGATGLIGVALVEALLTRPETEHIYAVVRPGTRHAERLPADDRIAVVECHARDLASLPDLIHERCDAFYHLAWTATGQSRNDDIGEQCANIGYTLHALHTAGDLGCHIFIGAGSQAEYGVQREAKTGPDSPANPVEPYGVAKYAAGKLTLQEARRMGMRCAWVRVFSVYGKHAIATSMIPDTLDKLARGEHCAFTDATQTWDYLYCADAGKAFRMIGEKLDGQRVYCLGSGRGAPLRSYIEQMRDIVAPAAELYFGELPMPPQAPTGLCADIGALQADTGWTPETDFCEGIKRMLYE